MSLHAAEMELEDQWSTSHQNNKQNICLSDETSSSPITEGTTQVQELDSSEQISQGNGFHEIKVEQEDEICISHLNNQRNFYLNDDTPPHPRMESLAQFQESDSSQLNFQGNGFRNIKVVLNVQQFEAYQIGKAAKNLILFGPPGSGKTLLIKILAKEAAEATDRRGKVIIFVPTNEIATMYERFFEANRSNQKRPILINPSRKKAMEAAHGFDDIFADEEFTGAWLPKNRTQDCRKIVVAIAVGQSFDPAAVQSTKDHLQRTLGTEYYNFFELSMVERNTKNIFDYYSQKFLSNSNITLAHNISGRNVELLEAINHVRAAELIANKIREILAEGSPLANGYTLTDRIVDVSALPDRSALAHLYVQRMKPKDIVVVIAHKPAAGRVELLKKLIRKSGIILDDGTRLQAGSIIKQQIKRKNVIAIDCSANVLSYEWPIAFVVDASNCRHSKSLACPVVSFSRATSRLIVVKTIDCNSPRGIMRCLHPLLGGLAVSDHVYSSTLLKRTRQTFLREAFASSAIARLTQILKLIPFLVMTVLELFIAYQLIIEFSSGAKSIKVILIFTATCAFCIFLALNSAFLVVINGPYPNLAITVRGTYFRTCSKGIKYGLFATLAKHLDALYDPSPWILLILMLVLIVFIIVYEWRLGSLKDYGSTAIRFFLSYVCNPYNVLIVVIISSAYMWSFSATLVPAILFFLYISYSHRIDPLICLKMLLPNNDNRI